MVEAAGLVAVLVALLWLSPYGELGLEVERNFALQVLALLALAGALWRYAGVADPAARPAGDGVAGFAGLTTIERCGWLWGLSAAISALASVDRERSLLGASPRLGGLASELALVGLGLLLAPRLARCERRDRLEEALLVGLALLAGYGGLQALGLDPLRWQEAWQGRPIATQGNPLFLGQLLIWGVPLAMGRAVLAWREHRRSAALAAAALAVAMLTVVLLTRSRGAALGLLAAGAAFAALAFSASTTARRRRGVAIAVLLAAALGLAALGGLAVRAEGLGGTAAQRLLLWRAVADRIGEGSPARWLVGYGQESLALIVPPYLPPELPGRLWQPDLFHDRAHNAALDALLARGVLGALAGLGLLSSALATAFWLLRRIASGELAAKERYRIAALAAGLVGQSVALSTGVATAAGMLVTWVTFALLAGARRSAGVSVPPSPAARAAAKEDAHRESTAVRVRGLLGGAALALLVFAVWVPPQVGDGEPPAPPILLLLFGGLGLALVWGSGERWTRASWRSSARLAGLWALTYLVVHLLLLTRASPGLGLVALAGAGLLLALLALAWGLGTGRQAARPDGVRWRDGLLGAGVAMLLLFAALGPARGLAASVALKEGRSALVVGDLELAARRLEAAQRATPWLDDALLSLVRVRMRAAEAAPPGPRREAEYARAAQELGGAAEGHPLSAVYPLELGHLQARWGESASEAARGERFARAESYYRRALARDPQSAMAHRGLGATLLALGRGAEAVEELATSLRLAPRSLESHLLLGRAKLAVGDLDGALAAFRSGRELEPRRARALLEGLAAARPGDPTAMRDLALLEIVEERREPALAALRIAMSGTPPEGLPLLVRLTSIAGRLP